MKEFTRIFVEWRPSEHEIYHDIFTPIQGVNLTAEITVSRDPTDPDSFQHLYISSHCIVERMQGAVQWPDNLPDAPLIKLLESRGYKVTKT